MAREKLQQAGYHAIGMDHFAVESDPMTQAFFEGTLHRNFMGYALQPSEDMVGFGVT